MNIINRIKAFLNAIKANGLISKIYVVIVKVENIIDAIVNELNDLGPISSEKLKEILEKFVPIIKSAFATIKTAIRQIAAFFGLDLPEVSVSSTDPVGDLERAVKDLKNKL